ncbi:redoxin domain-containing protein [Luteolibacter algae]|uniref:Redoxin domain-containing protein n=1 Tax=Luteolibacter algae TaxID=454151 RepID=A0ABW5DAM7_9BACT
MKKILFSIFSLLCGIAVSQEIPKVLPIGSDLPSFSLKGIDGKSHTENDYSSADILCLVFTCNHCPDAVAAAARMEEIHQEYKAKNVAIVAVNSNNPASLRPDELGYSPYNDSFKEMKPFAASYSWTFPYLYDGDEQKLATACGAQSTPHVFVFDSERKLRYTGRMDDAGRSSEPVKKSYLRDAFEAILAGKEIQEPVTRSFGCSTKWLFKEDTVAKDQKEWEQKPVSLDEMDEALAKRIRENKSGNVRMINFWSTTCGPCVAEFPALVETYRRFQNRNVDFISISMDPAEDKAKVLNFLESRHAAISERTKPSLKAEERTSNNYIWTGGNPDNLAEAIFPEWTGALPLTIIISAEGEVLWSNNSEIDVLELRKELLKGLE